MPLLDLNERLLEFRKSKIGKIVGILLAFLIALGLLALTYSTSLGSSSTVCFVFVAIALVLYGVPYFFGWRDKKKLAVIGVVLLLVLGVAFGLIVFNKYMSYSGEKISSSDGIIKDVTVTPFRGEGSTTHHFSALITNSSYDNVTMIAQNAWNGSALFPIASTGNASVPGGTMYYFNKTLDSGLYLYQVNASVGDSSLNTTVAGFGPIDLTNSALLEQLIVTGLIVVLMQVGILFFLFLLLSTLTSRSRERAKGQLKKKEEPKPTPVPREKLVCSECGAEVPVDANECPQCGEKFDEIKTDEKGKEEYVCTECGATVKEEDKKCWNCGKEFEN